ncbi:MAG: hypothetical protein U0169_06885 [Polyangiaceae bacterium]
MAASWIVTAFSACSDGRRATPGRSPEAEPTAIESPAPSVATPGAHASDGFVLDLGNHSLHVTLDGTTDVTARSDRGETRYRGGHAFGDLSLRTRPDGAEDFVTVAREPVVRELVYRVRLGRGIRSLREIANVLEFLDARGSPVFRVDAPWVEDADGTRHGAVLDVPDCPVDLDPRVPWGRSLPAISSDACTVRVRWSAGLRHPIVVDPAWTTTSFLPSSFTFLCENTPLLPSGRVLAIAPGTGGGASYVYDPESRAWSAVESTLSVATGYAACHALDASDGRVLLFGGYNAAFVSQGETRTYSEFTGHWVRQPDVPTGGNVARSAGGFVGDTTTPGGNVSGGSIGLRVSDGRVFFVGGETAPNSSLGVYKGTFAFNPSVNAWSTFAPMSVARRMANLVELEPGKIMVSGGVSNTNCTGGQGLYSSEILDTNTGQWSSGPSLPAGSSFTHGSSIRHPDGRIFFRTGGTCDPSTPKGLWLDTSNRTWTSAPAVGAGLTPNFRPSLSLHGGDLLALDDANGGTVLRLSTSGSWVFHSTFPPRFARSPRSLVELFDGRSLVVFSDGETFVYGCSQDSDCASHQYCGIAVATCLPKVANDVAMPVESGHDGTVVSRLPILDGRCTGAAANVTCTSGACSTVDDRCGYRDGEGVPGASTSSPTPVAACRSASVAETGLCGPRTILDAGADGASADDGGSDGASTDDGSADGSSPVDAASDASGEQDAARDGSDTRDGSASDAGPGRDADADADADVDGAASADAATDGARDGSGDGPSPSTEEAGADAASYPVCEDRSHRRVSASIVESCGRYACQEGTCRTTCARASECAEGFACDRASTCRPLSDFEPNLVDPGFGCSVGRGDATPGAAAWASFGLALLVGRRRKRP